jgi:hypothetical protein
MNNLKKTSPVWLTNLTGILAVLTVALPPLIQTLPGSVSNLTKDWLTWGLSVLTAVSGISGMATRSKNSDLIGTRPDDR